jgi:hypothetical protein
LRDFELIVARAFARAIVFWLFFRGKSATKPQPAAVGAIYAH